MKDSTSPIIKATKGYKLTIVGLIPEDWEVKPLREVAQIRSGIAKNSNALVADPILVHYLRVANVQDGFLDLSEMSRIAISRSDLNRFSVLPGDVLMNEGGDLDKLGRGTIWNGEFTPCVHQNHVFVVRCGPTVEPVYLTNWSAGGVARRYFLVAGKQTTNLASINKTALGGLPVVVPNTAEQRAIAEALSDVDVLIGALEKLIAKKQAIKQAAMQQLLTGRNRLPGFTGPWETKRLEEIADLHRQNVVPSQFGEQLFTHFSLPAFDEKMAPIVEPGNNIGSNKFRVPDGAILVSKLNPRIPRMWIPDNGILNAVASTEFLVLTPKGGISRSFLYIVCSSPIFCEQLVLSATGTTGSHQRITPSDALKISIRAPSDQGEQDAIAIVISDLDAEIEALVRRRDKTRQIKQGLMQQLLTGRIRLVKPGVAASERAMVQPGARQANVHFVRSVLAAEIIDQLHEQPTFGHVKFEKMMFLVEHLCEVETGSTYHRQAAGPYDNRALRSIDSQLRAQQWFDARKEGKRYQYVPMQKRGGHKRYFDRYFSELGATFGRILAAFKTLDTERCEIVATLLAAWNDLLRDSGTVSDESIVHEVLNNWHEAKRRIPEDRWLKALDWMRSQGFVPKGAT